MAIKDTLDKPKRNKLLEVLSQDYRAENIFLALVAIIAMAFSVMILSNKLNIKDSYPLIGAYPTAFAIILRKIPTIVKIITFITSTSQTSYGFTLYIQNKNKVETALNSIAIQKGLSIINIGVISNNTIKVVAGSLGLLIVRKLPKINSKDMDK